MQSIISVMMIASAGVVMFRCIYVIAHFDRRSWSGKHAKMLGLTLSYALVGGGVIGVVLGYSPAIKMLVIGIAGLITFDRRL